MVYYTSFQPHLRPADNTSVYIFVCKGLHPGIIHRVKIKYKYNAKDCCCFFSSFTSYQTKRINKSFISSHRTLLAHLLKQIHHYKFKLKPQKLRFQLWYLIQILIAMLFYHVSSSFFLIVLTHTFLISSVVEQIFNPIAELAIPLEIPVKQRSKNRS